MGTVIGVLCDAIEQAIRAEFGDEGLRVYRQCVDDDVARVLNGDPAAEPPRGVLHVAERERSGLPSTGPIPSWVWSGKP